MGKRRDGRLAAVQYLFAHDMHGDPSEEERMAFWDLHSVKGGARKCADELILGVLAHKEAIDARITSLLENFSFKRLAVVDRNVLRMAAFEFEHTPDVPVPVVINEAIEVAKMLGAGESGAFVNGILHKLAQQARPASGAISVDAQSAS